MSSFVVKSFALVARACQVFESNEEDPYQDKLEFIRSYLSDVDKSIRDTEVVFQMVKDLLSRFKNVAVNEIFQQSWSVLSN